jgi:outer membrane lipoprotein-sorting protein
MSAEQPVADAYPDLIDAPADAVLVRLIADLDAAYGSAEPGAGHLTALQERLRTALDSHAPVHVRAWHRRPLALVGIAAALGAVAAGVLLLFAARARSVDAEGILSRAEAATSAAPAGVRSYHLTAVGSSRKADPDGTTVTMGGQMWYSGPYRWRVEYQGRDPAGQLVLDEGIVVDGQQAWEFSKANGKTTVTVRDANREPSDPTGLIFPFGPSVGDLPSLLAQASSRNCGGARLLADTTVAARPVYVVAVGPMPRPCQAADGSTVPPGAITVWVDKQTFLPLKADRTYLDGGAMHFVVTQVAYNVTLPDSTFAYAPPPGAIIHTGDEDGAPKSPPNKPTPDNASDVPSPKR